MAGSTSSPEIDVVATVNALHWFRRATRQQLIRTFTEHCGVAGYSCTASPPLRDALRGWIRRVEGQQPPLHARVAAVLVEGQRSLGYDHTTLLGPRHANRIDDEMSVRGVDAPQQAGFRLIDVLLRDADQVVIGAHSALLERSRPTTRRRARGRLARGHSEGAAGESERTPDEVGSSGFDLGASGYEPAALTT